METRIAIRNICSTRSRPLRTSASISPERLAIATTPMALPSCMIGAIADRTVPPTVSSPVSTIMPFSRVGCTASRSWSSRLRKSATSLGAKIEVAAFQSFVRPSVRTVRDDVSWVSAVSVAFWSDPLVRPTSRPEISNTSTSTPLRRLRISSVCWTTASFRRAKEAWSSSPIRASNTFATSPVSPASALARCTTRLSRVSLR